MKHYKVRIECNITWRCNARCTHCNKAIGYAKFEDSEMTVEQMRRAVDMLIDQGIEVRRFTFCGGEPILHPNLQELIDEVARLLDHGLRLGRVLTNSLPATKHLRDKIKLPKKFKWVHNPLDDPSDPLSGKNDPKARPNKRFHTPFWISPADIGMESKFENCTVKNWCGIGLDAEGFSMCGKAVMLGKLLGIDASMKEGDIEQHVETPIEDICKHCQYGLPGPRGRRKGPQYEIYKRHEVGELPEVSETFEKAFAQHKEEPLVQLETL